MVLYYLKNEGLGGVVLLHKTVAIYSDSGIRLASVKYTKPIDAQRGAVRLVNRLVQNNVRVTDPLWARTLLPNTNNYPDTTDLPPLYVTEFDYSEYAP